MTDQSRDYGLKAETCAEAFLREKGYRILEKNYKTRLGEVDLIARDEPYLVFVEVKARRNADFGGPAAAITKVKQNRISRIARMYLSAKKIDCDVRFDIVLITGPLKLPFIELIQNAFDASF